MKRFRASGVMVASVIALGCAAQAAPPDSPPEGGADLRVTRVAIFSSGVAYFEREAEVRDAATAALTFRTEQINDIIKSMMVQDLGGGRIGVVSYASQAPVEKALQSFGVDITANPSLAELLNQLRGEPVKISGPRAVEGTILGVEKQRVAVKETAFDVDVVNVLTATGIQQVQVAEIGGVNLLNERLNGELHKALATLATSRDSEKKSVVLSFEGQGQRKVRVSYLLEAPIWKTSYRLALQPDGKPFLQGWATVENATEEDWKEVKLSLVSGRPISFTMDMYTPLYVPRPREELELYASLRPPEYEGEMLDKAGRPGLAGAGGGGGGAAEAKDDALTPGRKMERARRAAPAAPPAEAAKTRSMAYLRDAAEPNAGFALAETGVESVAHAQEAGELFEYAINLPVSISRQHSAMLPIVNQEIEGEKVSIYNPATHAKHPLNGLYLTNATGLNLMQGPVTVFDGQTYAGDAKLPDLKPKEKRLIGYALDLGVEVVMKQEPNSGEIVAVKLSKGAMIQTRKFVDDRTYTLKNKDQKEKVVLIEQPWGDDWKLVEPAEPFERTRQLGRFRRALPALQTATQRVKLERTASESIALGSMNDEQVGWYIRSTVISKAVKDALEKIVAMRVDLGRASREREACEKRANEAVAEQARIRENLKTLADNSDAHKRQSQKFDAVETQIENLRKQLDDLRAAEEQKRRALEDFINGVEVG